MRAHPAAMAALVALLAGSCDQGNPVESPAAPPAQEPRAPEPAHPPRLPPRDDADRLVEAHHLRWVSGDLRAARSLLLELLGSVTARFALRAVAALRLAELAEASGDRRAALGHLDQVKAFAGSGSALALEADDRRARILTATPLADLRGPIPGSVVLRGESPQTMTGFRQAEKLLASYHRIVVAPSLENVNEVLRTKRRALSAAVTAYLKVAAGGGPAAQAACQFRVGGMYHHLAEALAFESPSELLPSVARRLTRQLRAESASYLRRALAAYRNATRVPRSAASATWIDLAARESRLLDLVLTSSGKRTR